MPTGVWHRHFRRRIWLELEACRECGLVSTDLTFDHILPKSRGGRYTLGNITILCVACQHRKGNDLWPHQVSLWDEGYRGEVVLLPEVAPPPRTLTPEQQARRRRRDAARAARKAQGGSHEVNSPGCICSSCEFWRQQRIVGGGCGP